MADFKPHCYMDTDSVTAMKTQLNSIYGSAVMNTKAYIVVHRAKHPIVIFKKSIVAIERDSDGRATIYCTENVEFCTDEKYADVIKQLI